MTDMLVENAAPARTRPWLVLCLLATAQLMLVLDVTVVNVALPDIGRSLHLARGTVPWVLATYTVAFGGLMLLGGRVADLFGARRVLLAGLAVFTASSLACALADSAVALLAGRAAQGLGAAVLSPAALALVLAGFPGAERGKALAVWSSLSGAGAALGVVLGGVLTSAISWRWIFAINVPIGVAVLLAVPAVTTAVRTTATRPSLDVPGAALVTAGSGAAIYGLVDAGDHGWSAPGTVLGLAGAVVLWTAFALVERASERPLLAVALFRRRPVSGGAVLMIVATGLLVGGFFVGSFALQRGFGFSAVQVGLLFLPIAVATIVGAQSAGRALRRIDARAVAVAGLSLAAGGYGIVRWSERPAGIVVGLAVAALGIGAAFVTAFTASLADAAADESGLRSAIVGTCHELGGALGVAVLATATGAALTAHHVTAADFGAPFTVGAVAAVVGAVACLVLVPRVRS